MHAWQDAIRITQCRSKPQIAIRNTQYAVRNAHPCANNQIAIRNTQYAIRNTRPAANTQYAIRNTQYTPRWLRVGTPARNTQYAIRNAGQNGEAETTAIRNTQYANPVKPHCVIRKMLPQYAIAQYAAYAVWRTSHLSTGVTRYPPPLNKPLTAPCEISASTRCADHLMLTPRATRLRSDRQNARHEPVDSRARGTPPAGDRREDFGNQIKTRSGAHRTRSAELILSPHQCVTERRPPNSLR